MQKIKLPHFVEDVHIDFLFELQEKSAVTLQGAPDVLANRFNIDIMQAEAIVGFWLKFWVPLYKERPVTKDSILNGVEHDM